MKVLGVAVGLFGSFILSVVSFFFSLVENQTGYLVGVFLGMSAFFVMKLLSFSRAHCIGALFGVITLFSAFYSTQLQSQTDTELSQFFQAGNTCTAAYKAIPLGRFLSQF